MHLIVPHASALGEAAAAALAQLQRHGLPQLAALLGLLQPEGEPSADAPALAASTDLESGPEYRLNTPFEAALADLAGWPGGDGQRPLAAWWAARDGLQLPADTPALALLAPAHWQVDTEQISLWPGSALALEDAESRALLEAVRPSFEAQGWQIHYGAPLRWYVAHADLNGLRLASMDRAVGRNIDIWWPRSPETRLLRRLQSVVQMLLHEHPVNEARLARRLPAINSYWIWGAGPARVHPVPADAQVHEALAEPLLAGDWAAWCAAWQALDAGPIADLLARARAGQPVRLSLCGERHAHRWAGPVAPPAGLGPQLRSGLARLFGRGQPATSDPIAALRAL
jgi:hypothetical protein